MVVSSLVGMWHVIGASQNGSRDLEAAAHRDKLSFAHLNLHLHHKILETAFFDLRTTPVLYLKTRFVRSY